MSFAFDTTAAPSTLFRVGRVPDVWHWTDWRFAGRDGTFGCRWDDPQGRYRVLYAGGSRLGAFLEALAQFRPDLRMLAACAEIEEEEDDEAPLTGPAGVVSSGWRTRRLLGSGVSDGVQRPLVAVGGATSISVLRGELAALALQCGIDDLDAATIRLSAPRRFTQRVSRFIYEQVPEDGLPYAGIFYLSRYGDDVANYGVFERGDAFPITSIGRSGITQDDADFVHACKLLGIRPQ
jgi:hypothetical protein